MIPKVIRFITSILGFALGMTTYATLMKAFPALKFGAEIYGLIASVSVGIVVGIIFYAIEPWFTDKFKDIAKVMDKEISKYPQTDILLGFYRSYSWVRNSLLSKWYNEHNTYNRRILSFYYIWVYGLLRYKSSIKE